MESLFLKKLWKSNRPLLGQDPFVVPTRGNWILVQSEYDERIVLKFLTPHSGYTDVASQMTIWEPENELEIWAPELHKIDGLWYIYYASSDGNNVNHRTMVAGASENLINDPFTWSQRIGPDMWGIDMTVFSWNNKRYAVWSGWQGNEDEFPQHLFISEMFSPTEIGERSLLASPYLEWQTSVQPILEAPQAHVIDGKLFLFYSANASWTIEYAAGVLQLVGEDPLNPLHWLECPWPLVKNVGHGHFVEDRFFYHRKMGFFRGWTDREICNVPSGDIVNSKEFKRLLGN